MTGWFMSGEGRDAMGRSGRFFRADKNVCPTVDGGDALMAKRMIWIVGMAWAIGAGAAELPKEGAAAAGASVERRAPVVPPVSSDPSVKIDYDIVYVRAPRHGDVRMGKWAEF